MFLELVYEGRRRNTNGERGERGEGWGGRGRFLRVSSKSLSSHKWKKIDRQG